MKKLIGVSVTNMHAQAHEESEVVSQALYGQLVVKLDQSEDFTLIQTSDEYRGWILTAHLFDKNTTTAAIARTMHNAVHLYSTPHVTKQKPVLTLPFGVPLHILSEPEEEKGRWIEVELISGQSAWIQRANVLYNRPVLTLQEMMQLSTQFLGIPYTWGGTSSFGYDCSGFVQMLFSERGMNLPRDASQQVKSPNCRQIDENDLSIGDLIFFGSDSEKIKHVGIYLGNASLIHASVKPIPLVQISPLDEPTLIERFSYRTYRRVIS